MDVELPTFDWFPLYLSLKVAAVATVLALVAGTLARIRLRTHAGSQAAACSRRALMLPLVLPPTVIGYAILVAMGRRSPLGSWLREHFDYTIIFSWHGAVVASALVALPLVLKSASAAFAGVDRTMEAAARTLRQSPLVDLRARHAAARHGPASWPARCSRSRGRWVSSARR